MLSTRRGSNARNFGVSVAFKRRGLLEKAEPKAFHRADRGADAGRERGLRPSRAPAGDTAPVLAVRGPGPVPVALSVNGKTYDLEIEPRVTLLDALRERLGLTGTKKGCDQGTCGACTVLVDGRRVNSCLTLALMAEGKHVTTIEGLGSPEHLHPMQAAFLEKDGFQCGYCTPGQIISAVALTSEGRSTSDDASIRTWMSGNICRCGAYPNIVDAIRKGGRRA